MDFGRGELLSLYLGAPSGAFLVDLFPGMSGTGMLGR